VSALVLATLPLSTAAHEIAMALALAWALRSRSRAAWWAMPWAGAALAVAVTWILGSMASANLREGLGHAWVLAPLVALPALGKGRWTETLGLGAACIAASWSTWQGLRGGEGHAGLSHHLTLAYALLPALGVAVARRAHAAAAILVAGVLATRSQGAVVAMAVTWAAARWGRPGTWTTAGVLVAIGGAALWADPAEMRQRAVLWTGALALLPDRGVGAGAYPDASMLPYDALERGAWFPNHAHDSAIQLLAVLGPAGLLASTWLVVSLLRHGERGAAAGLAGLCVGALSQDTFGDLEVARAGLAWIAIAGTSFAERGRDPA
jgi:hypothetical protein